MASSQIDASRFSGGALITTDAPAAAQSSRLNRGERGCVGAGLEGGFTGGAADFFSYNGGRLTDLEEAAKG